MNSPASFLGGAKDRLLPASIPFRFFAAACIFHILAWFILLIGAEDLSKFNGEMGFVLAALHLLTLGVFVLTAMGASYQLLPVATLSPLKKVWPVRLSFWLVVPGTLLLATGMSDATMTFLYAGGALVGAGLAVFAFLLTDNLRRARKAMPIVTAHGWGALAALAGFVPLGLILLGDLFNNILDDRQLISHIHMVVAIFGFMGLLSFGFSQILIPMFALSRALPPRQAWLQFASAICAVGFAIVAVTINNLYVWAGAFVFGLFACFLYLHLMGHAFKTAMRKRLGLSFVMIKLSWGLLIAGLLTGLMVVLELDIPNGSTLFGFLIIVGWLLTFMTGILQRIIPFLTSMHAAGKKGMPPLLSELTAEGPLKLHAVCHFGALTLCATGIVTDISYFVIAGALTGLTGAIAFTIFAGLAISKLRKKSD